MSEENSIESIQTPRSVASDWGLRFVCSDLSDYPIYSKYSDTIPLYHI